MLHIQPDRRLFSRDPMIYGHFLEHFHRQIYGGVYDPASRFADEDGFRTDVIEALRRIRVPVIRWPGGCFVSAYHWEDGVGPVRQPHFDKAWRVEDPNAFGTDEFVKLCRKLGCEPYICTNAGSGGAEEMSNWLEYCNLPREGKYARRRVGNGFATPHAVKYWSIGNENYGDWEIGAKTSEEWSRLVEEAAKMMNHVDPTAELSAAALPDVDWNVRLLQRAGARLKWISIHSYWDAIHQTNALAGYDRCMAYTAHLEDGIDRVRGLLAAFGLEKKIRIAFDEWNLRGWYHPYNAAIDAPTDPALYLAPRDDNDINASYTMADAVFSACFLNALLRNADIVGMANFAPVVNTRGAIFTHPDGIVLRTTYHVFDMYVNRMGDEVVDLWDDAPEVLETRDGPEGPAGVPMLDAVATRDSRDGSIRLACVNKHPDRPCRVSVRLPGIASTRVVSLSGASTEDYNDIGCDSVRPIERPEAAACVPGGAELTLEPHSVNVVAFALDR